jgi:hypothetical protein
VWVVDGWMGMGQWWNGTDRGKLKYWEKKHYTACVVGELWLFFSRLFLTSFCPIHPIFSVGNCAVSAVLVPFLFPYDSSCARPTQLLFCSTINKGCCVNVARADVCAVPLWWIARTRQDTPNAPRSFHSSVSWEGRWGPLTCKGSHTP